MAGKISFPQVLFESVGDSNKITCLSLKKKETTYIEKDQTFSSWIKGLGVGVEGLIDAALGPIMEQRPAYPPVKGCTVNVKSHCTRCEKNVASIPCFKVAALRHS